MADPANIEALQAQRGQASREANRRAVLQRLLVEFAPQPDNPTLDYRGLLQRAQAAIAKELAEQEGA